MNDFDIDDLFEMRKNPKMNEFTDTRLDETKYETKGYIDKMNKGIDDDKWIIWAIEYIQAEKVIGSISIWNFSKEQKSGELGYGIIPDYQGKGLMREALSSVIRFGFEVIGLEFLEAYTEENNVKSINLLKGCNFLEVGRVDEEGQFNDRIYNMIIYRLKK